MEIGFRDNGRGGQILEISDARIIWPNFSGKADKFNDEGKRNFNLIIPDEEAKEVLVNDLNEYGVGWNVKIRPPRDEYEEALFYMPVKLKFNEWGPDVYLETGNRSVLLDEESVNMLDNIDIISVDVDIRPFDDIGPGGRPFRAAYVQKLWVRQRSDRFAERHAERQARYE